MQIGYHVLLLFEPLVNHDCGNSTHKGEWQMSLSQLDCTHMQLRLKHTQSVCMAARLCFWGKVKGEA